VVKKITAVCILFLPPLTLVIGGNEPYLFYFHPFLVVRNGVMS